MEAKAKHLEFIQSAISRMANNSFLLKGWSITLVGGLLALSFKEIDPRYVRISMAVLFFFWVLDSFYLTQERHFVKLYDHVRSLDDGSIDFSMHVSKFRRRFDWGRCAFSKTVVLFYGGLSLAQVLVLACL